MEARGGGPGKISVARDGSPSRWGGCDTETPGCRYAGTLSTDAIPWPFERMRGERPNHESRVEVFGPLLASGMGEADTVSGDDGSGRQPSGAHPTCSGILISTLIHTKFIISTSFLVTIHTS